VYFLEKNGFEPKFNSTISFCCKVIPGIKPSGPLEKLLYAIPQNWPFRIYPISIFINSSKHPTISPAFQKLP